jgi:hypothetical protein
MTDSKNTMNPRGSLPRCVAQSTNIEEMKLCRMPVVSQR